MYKVLIVDDEILSRYALRTLISKNFNNLEVVGEAESGKQAITLCEKFNPDIVIMDIKMPGMDGLEASQKILSKMPDINILILTAYDYFEYIQKAMEIGIVNYLLKPIVTNDTVYKINKVLESIESRGDIQKKSLEEKIESIIPVIEKELVNAFIEGTIDSNEINHYMEVLQYQIYKGYFMLISFQNEDMKHINSSIMKRRNREKIINTVKRYLPFMTSFILGTPIGNTIVLFIYQKEKNNIDTIEESKLIAANLRYKIRIIDKLDIYLGIGNCYKDPNNFGKSYQESWESLQRAIKESTIYHYCDMEKSYKGQVLYQYPIKLEKELTGKLKIGSKEECLLLCEQILENIFHNCFNLNILKDYLCQFIYSLKHKMIELNVRDDMINFTSTISALSSIKESDEVKIWVYNITNYILDKIYEMKKQDETQIIKDIYDYINTNFKKDISLNQVADLVELSPQYVSKLFKDKFNVNFIDYIIGLRLESSKELLKNTKLKIKEISKRVGYEDSNYFCRIFKKNIGMSPKEYRHKR
ncbi:response regulator [Vallitalea guaymasensis]|uniref:response regulator n=1 Tax=Vallitalea guaymasensis TaxID=1185412 RepID=UPI0023538C8E|nr:response regulator [Vallitalea guaymasensis]